jgi:hypothetical protein
MIKLSNKQFDDDGLECPACGCNNLHHGGVVLYNRAEDDEYVTVITAKGNNVSLTDVPNRSVANPSLRRHGMRINFYCEQCDDNYELCIAQHKGTTYLHWEK